MNTQQHTPAHDPDRLCIAANAQIASDIARQFSQGGQTVLVWSDAEKGKERYQWTLYVPRIQRDDKRPEADDLVTVVAAFHNGNAIIPLPTPAKNRSKKKE